MNRRDFLKIVTLLGGAVAASRCNMLEEGDETVIVVGAGVAGLSAASALKKWGYNVIVLEARPRVGGRIWTSREWADAPLDMGASWIHGITNNPIARLANANDIKTIETDYENHWIYTAEGSELTNAAYDRLEEYEAVVQDYITETIEMLNDDVSLQAVLGIALAEEDISANEKQIILYLLNTIIEHEFAADINNLSAFSFDQGDEFGGEDVIFTDGYEQIIALLADGLDIRLNEIVQRVEYSDGGVTITTNQNLYDADRAVITLPLGILKSGRVQFSPALPVDKQRAIKQLGMGLLDKVYLRFPHIFWPKAAELLGYIGPRKGEWAEWLNIAHYTDAPILLGFNVATFARQTEAWSDQQIVGDAMATLRTIFGENIPDPLAWQITRWAADPYALGSYSYLTPGTDGETLDALATPVSGRLFFAGEATSREYQATVHGAYLSGIHAAEELWDA